MNREIKGGITYPSVEYYSTGKRKKSVDSSYNMNLKCCAKKLC